MASKAEEIEKYLLRILEKSQNNVVELCRADLSGRFSCVPSQINYVLNTRFTTGRGYIVESRRGGGGYLRIVKLPLSRGEDILRLMDESEGQAISEQSAAGLICRLVEEGFITRREGRMMVGAIRSRTLEQAGKQRDHVRMDIVRAIILTILREE